jgi:hypothetical protein
MTEGNSAVHAAGSLGPPFIIGEEDLHFAVVVDPLFHGTVARDLTLYL